MRSFEPGFLERQQLTHNLLQAVRLLGEFKGHHELYRTRSPQALEILREQAVIQSVESSNRIEGVVAPLQRIQALIGEKSAPRNRPEQEIAGYRDALRLIHEQHASIKIDSETVLRFHEIMYSYCPQRGGIWKRTNNLITESRPDGSQYVRFEPVSAHRTAFYMDRLHERLHHHWDSGSIDHLIIIPAYVLDFLCVHPFPDGNGRIARLLTLLLLYQAGYEVGRYVSLERIVENSRESYYDALYQSSQGWHESRHTLLPSAEYLLGTVIAAYRLLEERTPKIGFVRGAKTELVLEAIRSLPDGFRIGELERACPQVSRDMIRVVLNRLKTSGSIWCEGGGQGAVWRKRGNNP